MKENEKQYLSDKLRRIKDFPKEGILFRDISSWLMDPDSINIMADDLYRQYADKGITKVVCLESRGFLVGAILAKMLHVGIVMARKPGKLPVKTKSETYTKEYGTDTIEMAEDAISTDDVVLIHDDLLATGGTALAAYKLVKQFNPKAVYASFLLEITDEGLHGRDVFPKELPLYTVVTE